MTSFFADEEFNHGSTDCVDEIQNVKNRFNNTVDYLSKNTNRLDSFMDIAGPYPKTKCGHEGVEGNQVIANYIIKMMNEKYQKIIPVNKDFLTLKSYYLKTDPYEKSNQHWI
jgi:hypothetical protein